MGSSIARAESEGEKVGREKTRLEKATAEAKQERGGDWLPRPCGADITCS